MSLWQFVEMARKFAKALFQIIGWLIFSCGNSEDLSFLGKAKE